MPEGKVIITVAPTGGVGTKQANPALPTQPDEIANDVIRCCEAGASVVAVHARRPDETATCDPDIYRDINARIRAGCDIVINNSTGGGPTGEMVGPITAGGVDTGDVEMLWGERVKGVEAGAEICTHDAFCANTYLPDGTTIVMNASLQRSRELAQAMKDRGIKPEWECFSVAQMIDPVRLIEEGLDEPPYIFNFVLGAHKNIQGAMPWSPKTLVAMVEELPKGSIFTVSGIGPAQVPAAMGSIICGGHVRVGLEDNIYYSRGVLANNLQLVERLARQVRDMGLEPATPAEAREMLGLPRQPAVQQQKAS
ncbi:MAG: 3-keto-5-aminohexanoate cleavage protein [Pseudomonadota bacterium]